MVTRAPPGRARVARAAVRGLAAIRIGRPSSARLTIW